MTRTNLTFWFHRLEDCTSSDPTSVLDFALSCPYASKHNARRYSETQATLRMTLGAPVFDLGGRLLGVIVNCGSSYDVKFAMKATYFFREIKKVTSAMHYLNVNN